MFIEDMNWIDVERYLEHDDRIVLILGACEQHSHLSLLSDIRIPVEIARAACREEDVLVAPPLPYGISPYFTAFPGTISLRPETFATVLREVLGGLLAQGFRRVLVSSGHGGNAGVLSTVLTELANDHPGARFALYHWWLHPDVVAVAQAEGLPMYHANWEENFAFTRVAPAPSGAKPPVEVSRTASAREVRAAIGDGSYGGPWQVSDEIMQRMLDAAVGALVTELRSLHVSR
jgi:creatinine amidohydrolase